MRSLMRPRSPAVTVRFSMYLRRAGPSVLMFSRRRMSSSTRVGSSVAPDADNPTAISTNSVMKERMLIFLTGTAKGPFKMTSRGPEAHAGEAQAPRGARCRRLASYILSSPGSPRRARDLGAPDFLAGAVELDNLVGIKA